MDGFKVAAYLRENEPKQFELLSTLPIEFHCVIKGVPYEYEGTVIQLNRLGEVEQIRYSNHTVKPFKFPMDIMEDYYEAYLNFSNLIRSDDFQIHFRFQEGDLNIIDNFRLLHGRTAFSKGHRSLLLFFMGRDTLYGRLKNLSAKK